jgi:hypothetical protein
LPFGSFRPVDLFSFVAILAISANEIAFVEFQVVFWIPQANEIHIVGFPGCFRFNFIG